MKRLLLGVILTLLPLALSAQTLYWDDPLVLEPTKARFPQAAAGGGTTAVVWQEFVGDTVFLSLRVTKDLKRWLVKRRFAGPYPFDGEEAPIFSLEVDGSGRIYLAVDSGDKATTLLTSADGGDSFRSMTVTAPETTVAPRLSLRADGGLYLFLIYDQEDSLSIYAGTVDQDSFSSGRYRGELAPVVSEGTLVFSFLPSHVSFQGREYVVYQSKSERDEALPPYQLYLKIADADGGFTEDAIRLTRYPERLGTIAAAQGADEYENQRPHLVSLGDRLAVVWERRLGTFGPNQIYYLELGADGQPLKQPEASPDGEILPPFERVTENTFNCLFPQVFATQDAIAVTWFDNRRGDNQIMIAERDRNGRLWREDEIWWRFAGDSTYGQPIQNEEQLAIVWENRLGKDARLVLGAPDQSVTPPRVVPQGFTPERATRSSAATFAWATPVDAAGIAGYSYVWSLDGAREPPRRLMLESSATSINLRAEEDGPWFFRLAAKDFADNWSESTELVFVRDTAPPGAIRFDRLETDGEGFLLSNDVVFSWEPTDREPLAGYTYQVRRLSSNERAPEPSGDVINSLSAGTQIRIQSLSRSFANIDNGLWAMTVAAIDAAGNIGPSTTAVVRTNRYVPVTIVRDVDKSEDGLGNVTLLIRGRGFTEEGTIQTIFLDRDGKEPYDYLYQLADGDFRVLGDLSIEGPTLTRYEAGSYLLGLVHPKRGLFTTTPFITLDTFGTVKIGDFRMASVRPFWESGKGPSFVISFNDVVVWFIVVFLGFIGVLAGGRLYAVAREGKVLREEVFAVLSGDSLARTKEQQMTDIKRHGLGLRGKFTLLIVALVLIVVLMLSIPLSYIMIQKETANLTEGLRQRARVLLGGMSGGAKEFLLDQDALALSNLTNQITSMPEAEYATITGITARDAGRPGQGEEYVWATNDRSIRERQDYGAGATVLTDSLAARVGELSTEINEKVIEAVSDMVGELEKLRREIIPLIGRTDAASLVKSEELRNRIGELAEGVDAILLRAASEKVESDPAFDIQNPVESYVFYQPIVYRQQGSDIYYRGLVRLRVSAKTILLQIKQTRDQLLVMISIIAVAALGLGTLGALLLASITIGPIKKLVRHVEKIGFAIARGAEKAELGGDRLEIKQNDEIGDAAEAVTRMEHSIVAAAIQREDLMFGKGIQKRFLPKEAEFGTSTDEIEIFAYYRGADELSGDYFNYMPLDAEHYVAIKSDVSGHGITAALIMIEVATVFMAHFNDWSRARDGLRIDEFLYLVNDLIAERNFVGKFAAIAVAIINVKTGVTVMTNAGDNLVHIYDSGQRKMIIKEHAVAPAAGPISSDIIKMGDGYQQAVETLKPGDILFLMTDGIEESMRARLDSNYEPIMEEQKTDLARRGDEQAEAAQKTPAREEFTMTRAQAVLNAVQRREKYVLERQDYPDPEGTFTFDFTRCDGTAQAAVLALMSIEKVFRIYTDPSAGDEDMVYVDRAIDSFLKEHFVEYSSCFGYIVENSPRAEDNEVAFSHLKEDTQLDDLTVVAIRRK